MFISDGLIRGKDPTVVDTHPPIARAETAFVVDEAGLQRIFALLGCHRGKNNGDGKDEVFDGELHG